MTLKEHLVSINEKFLNAKYMDLTRRLEERAFAGHTTLYIGKDELAKTGVRYLLGQGLKVVDDPEDNTQYIIHW